MRPTLMNCHNMLIGELLAPMIARMLGIYTTECAAVIKLGLSLTDLLCGYFYSSVAP